MKVMILANRDPTSSTIFRPICDDSRLEIVCIAFTETLTKSKGFWQGIYDIYRTAGLPYFIYISFWNGIFLGKEWLIWHIPFLKRIFYKFFSLKLWAQKKGIEIVSSSDFNSLEFLAVVSKHQPDILFTRANQILKEPILESTPHGCWCFHSSELPKYQGIAAEFHNLLNGEKTVGFTIMQMERKLDTGPIIAQDNTPIPEKITLHKLIEHNNTFAHKVIQKAVNDLLTNQVNHLPQDLSQESYYSWPTSQQTRAFRRKKLRYISLSEVWSYIFE